MFVIAGKNDPRVPVTESQQIADALKKQGTPVWLIIANDEGHGYRKKANQDFQFYATVEFLEEYLVKQRQDSTQRRAQSSRRKSPGRKTSNGFQRQR